MTLQDMPGHKLCRDYEDVKNWLLAEHPSREALHESAARTVQRYNWKPCADAFCPSLREKNNEDSGHNDILPTPREERSAAGHLCGSLHRTGVGEAGPSGDGAALLRTLFPGAGQGAGKARFPALRKDTGVSEQRRRQGASAGRAVLAPERQMVSAGAAEEDGCGHQPVFPREGI